MATEVANGGTISSDKHLTLLKVDRSPVSPHFFTQCRAPILVLMELYSSAPALPIVLSCFVKFISYYVIIPDTYRFIQFNFLMVLKADQSTM